MKPTPEIMTQDIQVKLDKYKKLEKRRLATKQDEKWGDDLEEKRIEFIEFCLQNRLTFEQIGGLLNLTRARVWQIHKYGGIFKGELQKADRKAVREKHNNTCWICRRGKPRKMHIHHIADSRSKNIENLVCLCAPCHRKLHFIQRKKESLEKELSTGGTLHK